MASTWCQTYFPFSQRIHCKFPPNVGAKLSPIHPNFSHKRFENLKRQLIKHSENGQPKEALKILSFMRSNGISPDLTIYSVLLKSCIRLRDFNLGGSIHAHLLKSNPLLDNVTLNSLISFYSKCEDYCGALAIFDKMKSKDLVSWSAIISCFSRSRQPMKAIIFFVGMLEYGLDPNGFCFSGVMKACASMETMEFGEMVFGFVLKTGFQSDLCVGSSLIDMFAKMNMMGSARKLFDEMPERNLVVYTLMITRYVQHGYSREGIQLFMDMVIEGFQQDKFSLSSAISACTNLGSLELGKQIHSRVLKDGLGLDLCIGCCIIDMYAKGDEFGSLCDSKKAFDAMPEHNVMSWTAIISGYSQRVGKEEEAIKLFVKMVQHGKVKPNQFTYSSILKACASLSNPVMGEQVHAHVVKAGLSLVTHVGNSCVSMYSRSGRMDDARKVFDYLYERNLISWNTILDGYARNSDTQEAFTFFEHIESMGIEPTDFTFSSLLSAAASLGTMGKGMQIHARVIKSGFECDQCIVNSLISMYSRCGNIEDALKAFEETSYSNVISWTSMIIGLARHGYARKSIEFFNKMTQQGVKPNEITFVGLLTACSHVGLVKEGWEYFNSMYSNYGIVPRFEHYACMVDLLGRSGLLKEAYNFILDMPLKADALVWRTLLGACRKHGELEIGKYAAKHMLEIEPHDPSAYVLLSNLYAATGEWTLVSDIRRNIREKKMMKEAGCSWIEVDNSVYAFYVGDTSNPRTKEIYGKLDELVCKIKCMGYVPDTSFVLHDLEEEQKEKYVIQHSEKLAIAFGIISSPPGKPIRVFKNLRLCGDCHNAIKYISVVANREIIVRDTNRFHHIKDGVCSCGDYW
ncbi:pentatricopeptide repeat-containing protein At3g49170, chloroplastic [Amborella trichopoda]|uniref:pentatricopeptide repeat-containing protein At3g49170, chloroplastic n=1 Tax=Amborella trichopoda TaxID=13333 RepID=UPI0009C07854|nr:pentatricopeptide repeat-containing protein At3g49170, chloroplastic [Amborella trichopoda]|eukprot:XP_011625621.2 pentatricopeptide repeat-containing protein At3g49170, chloroplastic [Amborella trichopoda]